MAIKRGVSLYSFQNETFQGKMDLEDCIRICAETGRDGHRGDRRAELLGLARSMASKTRRSKTGTADHEVRLHAGLSRLHARLQAIQGPHDALDEQVASVQQGHRFRRAPGHEIHPRARIDRTRSAGRRCALCRREGHHDPDRGACPAAFRPPVDRPPCRGFREERVRTRSASCPTWACSFTPSRRSGRKSSNASACRRISPTMSIRPMRTAC